MVFHNILEFANLKIIKTKESNFTVFLFCGFGTSEFRKTLVSSELGPPKVVKCFSLSSLINL